MAIALSGFLTEWLRVLEKVDALDASTIVTGHGAPLHDKTLLHATWRCFACCCEREGPRRKKNWIPALNDAFRVQLVDWYLHRLYEELDGPLSDAISKMPAS